MKSLIALTVCVGMISLGISQAQTPKINPKNTIQNKAAEIPRDQLPVSSPSLSAEKFESYKLIGNKNTMAKAVVPNPICIIGDDELSQQWFEARKNKLISLKALCFVVNITDKEILDHYRAAAPSLTILPLSGEWLHSYLQIKHYPALITNEWVAQ